MKYWAFALFAVAPQVFASSSLQDLMYFPESGTFWGDSQLSHIGQSSNLVLRSNKVKQSEEDKSAWALRQQLSVGILPELEMGLKLGLVFGGKIETKTMSTSSTTEKKFSGLEDIEINSRYRLAKEGDIGITWDVRAAFSPSLSNYKPGTTSESGNAQRGGHQFAVGTSAGNHVQNFSWKSYLDLMFNFESTEENAQTGIEQGTYSSHMDFELGTRAQMEFDPVTFGARLAFHHYGANDYTLKATSAKINYDSYGDLILGLDASMAVLDNLVGYGGFDYSFTSDQGFKSSNTDYDISDRSVFGFNLGAKYSF